MTLVAAWVRSVGDTRELMLATDSRLTGGHTWDVGPEPVNASETLLGIN